MKNILTKLRNHVNRFGNPSPLAKPQVVIVTWFVGLVNRPTHNCIIWWKNFTLYHPLCYLMNQSKILIPSTSITLTLLFQIFWRTFWILHLIMTLEISLHCTSWIWLWQRYSVVHSPFPTYTVPFNRWNTRWIQHNSSFPCERSSSHYHCWTSHPIRLIIDPSGYHHVIFIQYIRTGFIHPNF